VNIPALTAEASLYRTGNHYRASSAGSIATQSVMAAFTSTECSRCENRCNEAAADCTGTAVAVWLAGLGSCAASGPFYPFCAGGVTGAYAFAVGVCMAKLEGCKAINCDAAGSPCCPVSCGNHCCGYGEKCMRYGCCPANRVLCGDDCCNLGETCCGGKCCPAGSHCCGDSCCEANVPCCGNTCCSLLPPPGSGPTPPPNNCIFGGAPCGPKCCPPGLECCGYTPQFGPDCKTSCIR
jgi:hypothetical protein